MDTLTHALSGALLGRATAPTVARPEDPPHWQRISLCAVAAAFPDSDFFVSFFSPFAYLLHHRGATHSLLLMPLWAVLLAFLAAWCFRQPRAWRAYVGVSALGIVAHIAGDLITNYGTMILAPFSDRRFAWGTTFIIDLRFSGIIIAGLLASLLWKRSRLPAIVASLVLVSYVCLQAVWQSQAVEFGERYAREKALPHVKVTAQPGAVSPLNWMVVVENQGSYRYAFVNLMRKEIIDDPGPDGGFFARLDAPYHPPGAAIWHKAALLGSVPEDAGLAREVWMNREMGFFRWFAQYPSLISVERDKDSECAWFQDLRFVRPGTQINPFRFGLCRNGQGAWQRLRLGSDGERLTFD